MAPAKRRSATASAPAGSAVARPNAPTRAKRPSTPVAASAASESSSLWFTFVSTYLPVAIITGVAYGAVAHGFTTAPEYVRSKPLMAVFRRAFIALVCLASRAQLSHVYFRPNKPVTLTRVVAAHAKALAVVILANCAGTTVIQPLIGQPPAYAKTIELVVPVYFAVEAAVGLLRIPTPVIQFVVGFLVSWLKAATTSTLVLKWSEDDGAHPLAFVVICTTNLFASGLVLRFVAHYDRTRRVWALSRGLVWSLLQSLLTGGFVGLLAFGATQLSTQPQREREAAALYFGVAWYALDKYWRPALRSALVYALASETKKTA